jgi:hypothetical protein
VNDSLRLELGLPEKVKAGQEVIMTLRVENTAKRTLELYLTGEPPAFDLIVTDEGGEVIWRRLEGEVVTMVLRLEALAPGEALTFSHPWDQRDDDGVPVPPGAYTVRGELLTEGDPLASRSRTLIVVPDADM